MKTATGSAWFLWGLSPSHLQDSAFARQRLLKGWLRLALLMCLILAGLSLITDGVSSFLAVPLLAALINGIAYGLLKFGNIQLATWLALLTITGGVLFAIAIDPNTESVNGFLLYLALGNLLAGLLLSWQQMLFYNILNLISFVMVPVLTSQANLIDLRFTLIYIFALNVVTVLMVWVLSAYQTSHQQQLQAHLEAQRQLLELAFDGVLVIDSHQQVIDVSESLLARMNADSAAQLTVVPTITSLLSSARPTWQAFNELELQHPSGESLYFEGAYQRQNRLTVLALRDISRRKREERRLFQRNDYLAALHHTAIILMQTQDRHNILQMLLGYAAGIAGTSDGGLITPANNGLKIAAGIGIFESVVEQSLSFQDDIAGYVWRTRLPISLDNYHEWKGRHPLFEAWSIKAMVGVPLIARDVFYGVIQLGHTDERVFSEHDLEALIQFTDLAALALHNATLYDDLRDYQQRLRAIVENTTDAIYIKDLEGRYLLFNPSSARIFKTRPERVVGQIDREILPPDLYAQVSLTDQRVIQSKISYTYEFEQEIDGIQATFLVTKFPYISAAGALEGIVSISRDVTMVKQAERELRRSEAYYRALINNALDIILIVDQKGSLRFYNESFERLLGYAAEELAERSVIELVHVAARKAVLEQFRHLLAGGSAVPIECPIVHKAGHLLIFELMAIDRTSSPIIEGYIINARDVTPRKEAQQNLQRYLASMEALHDANTHLSQSLNFERVFETLVVAVARIFPQMNLAAIHLIGTSELQPYPVQVYDRQAIQNAALVQSLSRSLSTLQNAVSAKILNIADLQAVSAFSEESHYNGSMLIVPMLVDQAKFGTLSIVSASLNAFDEKDEVLADMLIRQTGVILERVQLFREEQQRRRLSESLRDLSFAMNSALTLDELFAHVLFYVTEVIPNDACNIMLLDTDRNYATVRKIAGNVPPHVRTISQTTRFYLNKFDNLRHVAQTQQPIVVADTATTSDWLDINDGWLRSYACAPIINGQEVIGFLNLDSTQPHFYANVDTAQLMVFANQIGVAIEKIRLIEAEKAQRELSDTLREVSGVLTRPMSREALLQAFLEQVSRVVPYDAAAIWFLDDNRAAYFGYGVGYEMFGVQDAIKTLRHTPETSRFMREMIATGAVIIAPEVADDKEWQDERFAWIQSWAGAPIIVQGQYFGKLTLDSTIRRFYNQNHIPLLETLTRQLSIALENVILLEQVQDYASQLELRVQDRTLELSRERKQLQTIVSSMDEGVIYFERLPDITELSIRYVNASLCRLLGTDYDSLIGQPLSTIIGIIKPKDAIEALLNVVAKADGTDTPVQQTWRGEFVMHDATDFERDCAVTLTVVSSETTHQLVWALMVIRDISQEKALMAQRERFVANASHELRNPLSNLVTRMYLLRNQPERQEEHISVMHRTVERLTALAEDLLDITRFNNNKVPLNPHTFDLRHLIKDIMELQHGNAELKRVSLIKDIPDSPVLIWADEKRIHQVITNLVVNAISYTKEDTTIQVTVHDYADHVVLYVDDDGIGIGPELHDQIFAPFFRASEGKVSGTGLGLAITKEIVERHEGDITVESDVGKGSRFVVRLPKRLPAEQTS